MNSTEFFGGARSRQCLTRSTEAVSEGSSAVNPASEETGMFRNKWALRLSVSLAALAAVVLGMGSAASASPVRVVSGDTFSKLVKKHCGTNNWQDVSLPGRNKNKIYAGETIDITCAKKSTATAPAVTKKAPATTKKISTVVNFAMAQVGKPYRWAAAGPNAYDCSGLVTASYARIGVRLPHQTGAMLSHGKRVSRASLRVGDIVWLSSHHVGLYIGGNRVVVAPQAGERVKVQKIYAFYTARRMVS